MHDELIIRGLAELGSKPPTRNGKSRRPTITILKIRERVFDLILSGATTKEIYFLMKQEFDLPPRTVENHRNHVLNDICQQYQNKHLARIAEALVRKEWYVNFWKEKYKETNKISHMGRAEASEDGLNELKFRTNILPDTSKSHIQINQQTNTLNTKPDIDVVLAAIKADKEKRKKY